MAAAFQVFTTPDLIEYIFKQQKGYRKYKKLDVVIIISDRYYDLEQSFTYLTNLFYFPFKENIKKLFYFLFKAIIEKYIKGQTTFNISMNIVSLYVFVFKCI